MDPDAFELLSRYFDVMHWSFCRCQIKSNTPIVLLHQPQFNHCTCNCGYTNGNQYGKKTTKILITMVLAYISISKVMDSSQANDYKLKINTKYWN